MQRTMPAFKGISIRYYALLRHHESQFGQELLLLSLAFELLSVKRRPARKTSGSESGLQRGKKRILHQHRNQLVKDPL